MLEMSSEKQGLSFETICAQELKDIQSGDPHILPIHATSAFSYENIDDSIDVFSGQKQGYVYTRYGNPTITAIQDKLAMLESYGTEIDAFCIMCNSGLAAISTLCVSLLDEGDELITQGDLYGGTTEIFKSILSRYGIKVHFTDLKDLTQTDHLIRQNPRIKMMYFETPSNPTLACLNIRGLTHICKQHDIISATDNTFSTPYLQQPFKHGVDFVIHSTTKFINGHGNAIAGAIIGKSVMHQKKVWNTMKLLGTNSNAWDAWLTHTGIKTLPLRMDKHCFNAMSLAHYLEAHPRVKKVNYPGLESFKDHAIAKDQMSQFGAMLSFEIEGGVDAAKRFMNNTRICSITSTLGNVDTLLLHPVTSSHLNVAQEIRDQFGITDGLIRVSVGIENVEDLKEDFERGLQG